MARRGFFFQSLTASGPQPLRTWSGAWIHLTRNTLPLHRGMPTGAFGGVYFLGVRTPYVVAGRRGQTPLLDIPTESCCFRDGKPLPKEFGQIAAMRGTEILLTGDWFSPPSLTILACNVQFIVNLLTTAPEVASGAEQEPTSHATATGHAECAVMISASKESQPFVELVAKHLQNRSFRIISSCDDGNGGDMSVRIPGDLSAFVPIIDRKFSPRQEAEANAAITASRQKPGRLAFDSDKLSAQLRSIQCSWSAARVG